jgi:hypothetical protein
MALTLGTNARVKQWIRRHNLGFYALIGFLLAIKTIYLLGEWVGLRIEFILYTASMFLALLCFYWKRLNRAAFWITWFSLLLFVQIGVFYALFIRYWPSNVDPMRIDLLRIKLLWGSVFLVCGFYMAILSWVMHSTPQMFHSKNPAIQARDGTDNARQTESILEVPALTFQLLWHNTYRCPRCHSPLERKDLRYSRPFPCTFCGTELDLVRKVPVWINIACMAAGAGSAWLLGVREPFTFLLAYSFLFLTAEYLVAPFIPPIVEVHQDWCGVGSELFAFRNLKQRSQ